jgi:hypothetical protein
MLVAFSGGGHWHPVCHGVFGNGTRYCLTLKKIARQFRQLAVAHAYANWTDPTGWHAGDVERLATQGVELVFVWTRRDDRSKEWAIYVSDMVDLRLACDCMELLATHPEIS